MIEVTKETTKLEGTKVELMSEFCCLVNHLVTKSEDKEDPILTREELDLCIKLAMLSSDELHRKAMTCAMIDMFIKDFM